MLMLQCRNFVRLCPLPRFFSTNLEKQALVLGAHESDSGFCLTDSAKNFDNTIENKLSEQLAKTCAKVKAGKTFIFWNLHEDFPATALVGLGKDQKNDELEIIDAKKESIRIAASAGCRALQSLGFKNLVVEPLGDAEAAAEGANLGLWKFQQYKSKAEPIPEVRLFVDKEGDSNCDKFIAGTKKAQAQNLARRLADTPSNLLTPSIFAQEIEKILTPLGGKVIVRDQKWAEEQKMGSYLCVAKGSIEPPKFVEVHFGNTKDTKPIVLVGKGVCFDSGGISIKPSSNMDQMRADMGGAAAVVGALAGLADLGVKTNLVALLPLVENMPSGSAVKPGDVVFARNGKSICVDNTDAEGRLILADALCYAKEFNPKWVLDIATLTGAMSVALGNAASGVFSNSNNLYKALECSGALTGDRVWRFPLWKHYTKQMTRNAAYDINNVSSGKGGGSCTAAAFLREFVPENTDWLHWDIASVMGPSDDTPYLQKGMTGRPTRTMIEFIKSQADTK